MIHSQVIANFSFEFTEKMNELFVDINNHASRNNPRGVVHSLEQMLHFHESLKARFDFEGRFKN